ncbi:SDR family oxidoreductase [Amycolatopsis taiwanensis]|uniref:Nucleoside-diphosphate sugar epimerase n=1 Tax=Amycolatopsis taiwanensis TaxID=342230 RepID=A0A9W6VLJ0_9PSEU|nr:NAD(P)H-binding protein [Amycolatopsis taiwanensis]GLY71512.1 nucleoside-diphosphate sugar epimerase [Amycolatopsis taiwanensis]
MKIAVMGATGTAGSRVVRSLKAKDVDVVEASRSQGVDLVSGDGLAAAVAGADAVIDASNAFPPNESMEWSQALTTATRNVVETCSERGVNRLVFLSISGVENPAFDNFPYYVAKREQEKIVKNSGLGATILKTTQWYEFATNPAAVTFREDEVEVQDWLIQPVAVDTVADVLVREALQPPRESPVLITGPNKVRLPELVRRRLEALGDARPVRTVQPPLAVLGEGALVAPQQARVVGPDVDTWLAALK